MDRSHQRCWSACWLALAIACLSVVALRSAKSQLRPNPAALASAPPDLIERLRADPFAYFRFINRAWTERVCEAFADTPDLPIVRLHGDAHVEQFALTKDAWGLDDFDDSARGPGFIDLVRFLGSIDLATRQRHWTRDRDRVWNRFLEGYRQGLSNPDARSPEPSREMPVGAGGRRSAAVRSVSAPAPADARRVRSRSCRSSRDSGTGCGG